tara:strand:- start:526 stop:1281 length:756 start_codon:yes stop_codon:yes gene_type:complete
MNIIDASLRDTKTKGEIKSLRSVDKVPAILYGGKEENQKISISKKILKSLLESENFLSNIVKLKLNGKEQQVIPREVVYDTISDEPIHLDFMRVMAGTKIILEIPVKFINNDKSPGLKRGGVLNIVRRKVELKCPTNNIPSELVIDLEGMDIGVSFKISSVKLPDNVMPTITDRDFVIATLAAPTIIKEPEKPAETAEGEEGAEVTTEGAEGEAKTTEAGEKKAEGDKKADGDKKAESDKKPEGGKKPEKK